MREILFRGKRKDNGNWIAGGVVHCDDKVFIVWAHRLLSKNGPTYFPTMVEVIPETLGQYTGAKDKNGKEIFKGDIVRHTQQFLHGTVDSIGVVAWSDGYGAWIISKYINNRADMFLMTECHRTEIIGNIHDNPELLEVDHD